jgi:hypothetical protein
MQAESLAKCGGLLLITTSGEVSPAAQLRVTRSPGANLRVTQSLTANLRVKWSPETQLHYNLHSIDHHHPNLTSCSITTLAQLNQSRVVNIPLVLQMALESKSTTRRLQMRFTDNDGNEFDLGSHTFKYLQLKELEFVTTELQAALQASKKAKPFVAKFTKVSNRDPKHKSPASDFDLLHSFCYGGSKENDSLPLIKRLGEEFSRKLKNTLLKVRPQAYVDIITYTSIDEFNSEPIRSDVDGYCEICADNFTTAVTDNLEYAVSKAYKQEKFRAEISRDDCKY